jgi:hypothetical protein
MISVAVPLLPTRREQGAEANRLVAGDPGRGCPDDPTSTPDLLGCSVRHRGGRLGRRMDHSERLTRGFSNGRLRSNDNRLWLDNRGLAGIENNCAWPSVPRMNADSRAVNVGTVGLGSGMRQVPIEHKEKRQQHAPDKGEVPSNRHEPRPILSPDGFRRERSPCSIGSLL